MPGKAVRFQVWVPMATQVEVAEERAEETIYHPMKCQADGVFTAVVAGAGAGLRYKFRLNGEAAYPDPYSRFQPEGVHGPSQVVDPAAYAWHDAAWPGVSADGLVIYETHVGTYTPAGTFEALIDELAELKALGVNALELMPVGEFAGQRNWGYDGVSIYAPTRAYGGPLGLKRLVDAAHQLGLGVLLDVVYNHLGPDGNYLRAFSPFYFTDRYQTPWGEALNFDGPESRWVRHYVVQNACYWLNEYHFDGLRLDATHAIFDESAKHILREIAEEARAAVPPERRVVIIAESAANDVKLIDPPAKGGCGLDAVWADDFHHTLRTFLTGEQVGYYEDYPGRLADLATTIKEGFLYQGAYSRHLGRPQGTKTDDQAAKRFVFCIQNHDQVGNRALGERLNQQADRARYLVASALLLLAPETPLLFMGQEFAASTPFLYFTDHHPELGRLVTEGRRAEFKSFAAFSSPELREQIPDPQAESTFLRSKLDLRERQMQAGVYRLYRDLLRLRRTDPIFCRQDRHHLVTATQDQLLAIYYWHDGEHRLIIAYFGEETEIALQELPFPRSVPAGGWSPLLVTTDSHYGGVEARSAQLVGSSGQRLQAPGPFAVVLGQTR